MNSQRNAFIHDPINPQYPFAQWNGKSEHEGKLLFHVREGTVQQCGKSCASK